MGISEVLGFSHFPSIAQMLSFTACIKTAANLMLGGKGSGLQRVSGSLVVFFQHANTNTACETCSNV